VRLLGRVRAIRVFYARPGVLGPGMDVPCRHGDLLKLSNPGGWPMPQATSTRSSARYGTVVIHADRHRHQRLTRRDGWHTHPGVLPIVKGAVIQVQAVALPSRCATSS
jgi:hypothetical protein